MKNEITAKRLIIALEKKGMKAQELADKSGVSKVSISQYTNGAHAPSNISAGKMGKVLEVNPLWLMGFDTPMEETVDTQRPLRPDESSLLEDYNQLSDVGQHKVCSYTKKLLDVEQAENLVNAAHSRTDIDVTDEMMIHDEEIMGGDDF